jgi:catechol 2,3-dioxygenase-like lactoylglutathione lyase family enzyme
VINAAHVVLYSRDAEADRAFLRDVLAYPFVDAGDGWLIFKAPPTELAVHPAGDNAASEQLYFMCEDLEATTAELAEKGVALASPVANVGWGVLTSIQLPGGGTVGLYQPRHETAHDL